MPAGQSFILPRMLSRDRMIERIATVLQALPMPKAWQIEIKEHKPKRSDQQNRYLWGVVYSTITEHLEGWHADDVHDFCLGECYGWETISGLGKKRLRPIRRSSTMNKIEFAHYIAWIQQRMAEHGIFIPDPDPLWFEHAEDAA